MTEIFLIRHAEAVGNLYRMMQGHWDGDVTEYGRLELKKLAERFRGVRLDAVYSSDLYRAMLTADAVRTYHPSLELQPRRSLRELDIGPWETLFYGDLSHDQAEQMHRFKFDSETWRIEGAETFREAGQRACRELKEIAARHEGQAVAVVSHGVTIRSALSELLGIPLNDTERLPICFNTAVTKLVCEDGVFRVEYFNDVSHLQGMPVWNGKAPSFRTERLDPAARADYYCACYEKAWLQTHGSLKSFSPEVYLSSAMAHAKANPDAVLAVYDNDTPAGLLDLDPLRGAAAGYGWISLLYLEEDYRNKGYGIQVLARAIKFYTGLGRNAIRLTVSEKNNAARKFYEKWGFREIGSERNAAGRLYILEKRLTEQRKNL